MFVLEIAEFIERNYKGKVVEVGVGRNYIIADYLAKKGFEVVTTDLNPFRDSTVKDDITNPNIAIYRGSSLIYSIRPPYEIQGDIVKVAGYVGCDAIIYPLKNEIIRGGKLINFKGTSFYIFAKNKTEIKNKYNIF